MRFHYLIEKSLNIDHYCFISCIIKSLMSLLLKLYYSNSLFFGINISERLQKFEDGFDEAFQL